MKYATGLSVVLLVLGAFRSANAGFDDLYVTMRGGVTEEQKQSLKNAAKVTESTPIISLGKNVEIWKSSATPATLKKLLDKSVVISSHAQITGDYRELFSDIGSGADLSPTVAQRIATIRGKPTSDSVRIVRIQPEALANRILSNGFDQTNGFAEGGTFKMTLADIPVLLTKHKLTTNGTAGLDWTGVVGKEGDGATTQAGVANMTLNNGNVIGRIVVDSDVFSITPLGNGIHAITKVNQSKLPPEHPPSHPVNDVNQLEKASEKADAKPSAKQKTEESEIVGKTGLPVINVAVFFTPHALAKLAGATPQHFAESLINQTNATYVNSNVGARLNLVGVTTVNHKETDWDLDLDALENAKGTLAPVRAWRRKVGANLVVGIVGMNSFCGKALAIMAESSTAFALVSQECALDNLSFAHEVGHLQGARHDEETDPDTTPFSYGHGYRYISQWRTVMAYDCLQPCVRLPYWANPDVRYKGVPMGTKELNFDAKVLTQTAVEIRQFKPE